MAATNQPWLFLLFFFLSTIHLSSSQSFSSQNLEAFFPFFDPSPIPSPSPAPAPFPSTGNLLPPPPPPSGSGDDGNENIVKAVVATAASTFAVATLLFFFVTRYVVARRRNKNGGSVNGAAAVGGGGGGSGGPRQQVVGQFVRSGGNVKGLIVDENGLDVVYWRKLEGQQSKKNGYQKKVFQSPLEHGRGGDEEEDEESTSRNEIPLLRGKSSTSQFPIPPPNYRFPSRNASSVSSGEIALTVAAVEKPKPSPPLPPPPPRSAPPSPPPPPKQEARAAPPPPPLPPHASKFSAPPPPPPPRNTPKAPPPPPPIKSAAAVAVQTKNEESSSGSGGQVKLKPLHWDKVNNTNADHSMVWDKLHGGSFRVDGDLMEALFGTVATNRKSPNREESSPNSTTTPNNNFTSARSQIVILDPRKSQNIAIVLKSIAISRKELLESLTDGRGMDAELLEKLMRIAPTKEEETQILDFTGDPTRLADAESFLYHLLRSIPSAFTRANAMLFRANYASEIAQFKESLQTLEMGCKELRNRGLFVKLLEAILKAGNRMNAGTARGNAQAFKLSSLTKLSDVRSSDGKTTLLHFVVEEVVRSEGKRGVLNRNRSLSRNSSINSNSNSNSKDDKEKEYIMLGLPIVGGLSAEFTNVKKAAQIDYDTFASTCISIASRAAEVKQCLVQCAVNGEGGLFSKEMKGFLESADKEMRVLRESQKEVIELVKRTTEYYHPGGSNSNPNSKDQGGADRPLQLFVIIRDFLGMVDNVCVEIARSLQRRRRPSSSSSNGSSSPKSPAKVPVRFPNLPEHFLKEKSASSSSESDAEF